jgi:hypothetical protein
MGLGVCVHIIVYVRVTRVTVLRTTQEITLVTLHMQAHKWPSVFGMLRGRHVQPSDLDLPSNDTAMCHELVFRVYVLRRMVW